MHSSKGLYLKNEFDYAFLNLNFENNDFRNETSTKTWFVAPPTFWPYIACKTLQDCCKSFSNEEQIRAMFVFIADADVANSLVTIISIRQRQTGANILKLPFTDIL